MLCFPTAIYGGLSGKVEEKQRPLHTLWRVVGLPNFQGILLMLPSFQRDKKQKKNWRWVILFKGSSIIFKDNSKSFSLLIRSRVIFFLQKMTSLTPVSYQDEQMFEILKNLFQA